MEQDYTELMLVEEQPVRLVGRPARAVKRYAYAAVGAVALTLESASRFRHEIVERGIDQLAERGRAARDRRVQEVGEVAQMTRGMAAGLGQQVTATAGAAVGGVAGKARNLIGIASADDVDTVARRIDELNERLDTVVD
jgi:hypothetical protein